MKARTAPQGIHVRSAWFGTRVSRRCEDGAQELEGSDRPRIWKSSSPSQMSEACLETLAKNIAELDAGAVEVRRIRLHRHAEFVTVTEKHRSNDKIAGTGNHSWGSVISGHAARTVTEGRLERERERKREREKERERERERERTLSDNVCSRVFSEIEISRACRPHAHVRHGDCLWAGGVARKSQVGRASEPHGATSHCWWAGARLPAE